MTRLQYTGFVLPNNVTDVINNAVEVVTACKIFFAYNSPWWKTLNLRNVVTDLPNRQTIDFGTGANGKAVLLAGYGDMDITKYWHELQNRGNNISCSNANFCPSDQVVLHMNKLMAKEFNISLGVIPSPIDGAIIFWDAPPFNGAWESWRAGYDWGVISDAILKPMAGEDLYIATGAYGPLVSSQWIEMALRQADNVIDRYF